jgi:hypothetical protein
MVKSLKMSVVARKAVKMMAWTFISVRVAFVVLKKADQFLFCCGQLGKRFRKK